jgi:hypothetical protein
MMTAERGVGAPSQDCGVNSISALATDYSWGTQNTLTPRDATAALDSANSLARAGIAPPSSPNSDNEIVRYYDVWKGFRTIHQDPVNYSPIIRYTLCSNTSAADTFAFDFTVGEDGAYVNLEVASDSIFSAKTTYPGGQCQGYEFNDPSPWLGISGAVTYTWAVDGVYQSFTPNNGFFWARNGGLQVGAISGTGSGFIGPITTFNNQDQQTGVIYQGANVEGGWVILATKYFAPGTYRVQFNRTSYAYQTRTLACDIADFNHDGVADTFDYLDFVAALSNSDPSADINNDGSVDFFDYLDFQEALAECNS